MKIGTIEIEPPVVLAPMAGITDAPFRAICRHYGAGLVCSELISSTALQFNSIKTHEMMQTSNEERPVSIQIFGSNPQHMAEAARQAEAYGADIVDINMGCWVPKVVKTGSGAALLRDVGLAVTVAKAVVQSVDIPVTVKIRCGWERTEINYAELAPRLERAGVSAIALHARVATQGFAGEADWSAITHLKSIVQIPVIGNGDIRDAHDALRMFEATGCDAVMVGRAAVSNPWLFQQINHLLQTGETLPAPSLVQRLEVAIEHAQALCKLRPEEAAIKHIRGQMANYVKGCQGANCFRNQICQCNSLEQLQRIFDEVIDTNISESQGIV
ncbi:MAG: tRNA dihydrouridine synthase DusB [Armatimonadota bacterium]